MRVLLVTSEGACGIAEHSAYLKQAVEAADRSIEVVPDVRSLDPKWFFTVTHAPFPDVVHLNYHAALHSQWTPEYVKQVREHIPVVITYHDTGVPNSDHCKSIHAVADAFVVHEPCEDLPGAIYWRQGIPAAGKRGTAPRESPVPWLGTVGFPFPWKNYDLLAEATAIAGWGLLLLAPTATREDVDRWRALNPQIIVYPEFLPAWEVVYRLGECDATAFLYNCHNTGTSGAIRQGIAARKPVIASRFDEYCTSGRQFRDLALDNLAQRVITWINPDLQQVVDALVTTRIAPLDAGIVALAEQDSWAKLGHKYAQLMRGLCV